VENLLFRSVFLDWPFGGGRGGGGATLKGPNCKRGATKGVIKKIFGTFFYINNGMRKNFVNINLTGVCPENIFCPGPRIPLIDPVLGQI
jgi:hypothetical protein